MKKIHYGSCVAQLLEDDVLINIKKKMEIQYPIKRKPAQKQAASK